MVPNTAPYDSFWDSSGQPCVDCPAFQDRNMKTSRNVCELKSISEFLFCSVQCLTTTSACGKITSAAAFHARCIRGRGGGKGGGGGGDLRHDDLDGRNKHDGDGLVGCMTSMHDDSEERTSSSRDCAVMMYDVDDDDDADEHLH